MAMDKSTHKKEMFFDRLITDGQDYKFSDSPFGAHTKIIQIVGSNKKVLDVGCGAGYLAEAFKKNGCYVAGIETDTDRAKSAQHYLDTLIIGDVEKIENLAFPENYFDTIVFADILEHLQRPDILLVRLNKYLNKDGYLVISIPNIARIDIRIKLLFGNFNYENGGILDKTHLRFFTKKSFCLLLENCGYQVIKTVYSGLFSNILLFEPLLNMLAFQFIFLAKPNKIPN